MMPTRLFVSLALTAFLPLGACDGGGGGSTPSASEAAAGALKVMPLGDSITEGGNEAATYRYFLQKHLEGAGVTVDFVGSMSGVFRGTPRHADFDPDHEGHWGWTTARILDRLDEWAPAARPDVVLVHLGTNDFGDDPSVVPSSLSAIIDELRKANPDVVVFLARIIPATGIPAADLDRVNDAIEAMGRAKSTERSPILIVAHDEGFDAAVDTYDGTHPNEPGEKKMAEKWFRAIDAWRSSRGR
ncbi:MAG: SGNH/GDSL hydrolase family protein [Candidatus Binatia bacterium]